MENSTTQARRINVNKFSNGKANVFAGIASGIVTGSNLTRLAIQYEQSLQSLETAFGGKIPDELLQKYEPDYIKAFYLRFGVLPK